MGRRRRLAALPATQPALRNRAAAHQYRDLKSFFLGAIRGVRVWNRALTAAEVQMVASDSVPQDGLVAEYRLDQDVALDTTGLHNGRIVGGLWMTFRRGSLTK